MSNDVGRPTIYDPEVVRKLEAAFNNGYNITEACQYAEIARDTYYQWLEHQEGFSDKMDNAQRAPNKKAKEVVLNAINTGDSNLAFRYLQARDPDFKPKLEGDFDHRLADTRTKIKDFLDARHSADDGSSEPATTDTPAS